MAAAGLDGSYVRLQCDTTEFASLIRELRAGKWDGFNVTMPHKTLAFEMCDRSTEMASRAGSVNTLQMADDDSLIGHSSDVVSFSELFQEPDFQGRPVLVLGSGGAAAAAIAAANHGVYLSARNQKSISALQKRFGNLSVVALPFGVPVAGAVVVNATPLGMRGEKLPEGVLENAAGLIDLPYGPESTPAAMMAQELEIPSVDGFRFLALQAAESFLWWTGHEIDVAMMEAAAKKG